MIEQIFGVWKNRWKILEQVPSYDIKEQRAIVVATCILHSFIRKNDREDDGFNWNKHNLDKLESNSREECSNSQASIENMHDKEMKFICDRIAQSICGL